MKPFLTLAGIHGAPHLDMLDFVEGGKPEGPEKNPRSKDENQQQTRLTCDAGPQSNPGHIGDRRAFSPLC